MAECAQRALESHAKRSEPALARSAAQHAGLQRRAAARNAGHSALLNSRAPGPEPIQRARPNRTGLPDRLKSGVEALSGVSMDEVKVHYNSARPAELDALAYAQGTDIHLAPGQERHLPHEAWHVVQQAEGRVKPTMQMKSGVPINDDAGLEREADIMGSRADRNMSGPNEGGGSLVRAALSGGVHQRFIDPAVALYQSAADKWQNAATQAGRFNDELDTVSASHSFMRAGAEVDRLKANALAKGNKADTVTAGEAAEPYSWFCREGSPAPVCLGPGGLAGFDVDAFRFASGTSSSERSRVEVKTASSTATLRQGVASAYQARVGTVTVYYALSSLHAELSMPVGQQFTAAGNNYEVVSAKSSVYGRTTVATVSSSDGDYKFAIREV